MSRTIKQENDASVTSVGSWTAHTSDNRASGARWESTTQTGTNATKTYAIAANSGITGFDLLCMSRADSVTDATITVTGTGESGTPFTWNQWNHQTTAQDDEYDLYRVMSIPYFFTGPDSAAKTVKLTAGTTAGNGGTPLTSLDGIELYTAEAQVAGRLTSFGHSILYGITASGVSPDWAARTNTRFTKLFANTLSAQNYLGSSSWTDDNQGVPSEDLTNGSYLSGTGGTPYARFTNSRYVNQTLIYTPGWMRAEDGPNWPNPTPLIGSLTGISNWTAAANYMQGIAQWWARDFAVGLVMHGYNDRTLPFVYDIGGAVASGNRDAGGHTTAPVAGFNYSVEAFKQRLRELLYRPMLNIAPIPRIYVLGQSNVNNGAALPANDAVLAYDAAQAAVLAEPWVQNAYFVPLMAGTTGVGPVNISSIDIHLSDLGHAAANDTLRRFHDQINLVGSGMGGGRL